MRRRLVTAMVAAALGLGVTAPAAAACGFLVAPNGAVQLVRTTTLVAWEDGIERYVTSFEFRSDQAEFGSIIPLPAEPIEVERAGDWTLQRLQLEVRPPAPVARAALEADAASSAGVEVISETVVDGLRLTVLKGGGGDVLRWANDHGFDLPEDATTEQLLTFYSDRSPYFLGAKFDAADAASRGFRSGDGIPIQITVPTERPWVPLHILGFAKPGEEIVEADVFLLTPERPDLIAGLGLRVNRSEWASRSLLDDLRSDVGMDWVPRSAWFTHLSLEVAAGDLTYDLSVGAPKAPPSLVDAGITRHELTSAQLAGVGLRWQPDPWWSGAAGPAVIAAVGVFAGAAAAVLIERRRPGGAGAAGRARWRS